MVQRSFTPGRGINEPHDGRSLKFHGAALTTYRSSTWSSSASVSIYGTPPYLHTICEKACWQTMCNVLNVIDSQRCRIRFIRDCAEYFSKSTTYYGRVGNTFNSDERKILLLRIRAHGPQHYEVVRSYCCHFVENLSQTSSPVSLRLLFQTQPFSSAKAHAAPIANPAKCDVMLTLPCVSPKYFVVAPNSSKPIINLSAVFPLIDIVSFHFSGRKNGLKLAFGFSIAEQANTPAMAPLAPREETLSIPRAAKAARQTKLESVPAVRYIARKVGRPICSCRDRPRR